MAIRVETGSESAAAAMIHEALAGGVQVACVSASREARRKVESLLRPEDARRVMWADLSPFPLAARLRGEAERRIQDALISDFDAVPEDAADREKLLDELQVHVYDGRPDGMAYDGPSVRKFAAEIASALAGEPADG